MVESRIATFKQNISLSVLLSQLPSSGCICACTPDARPPANLASSKPVRFNFMCNHSLEMAAFMIHQNSNSNTHFSLVRQHGNDQTPEKGLRWEWKNNMKNYKKKRSVFEFHILFKLLLTFESPCHWGIPLSPPPFSPEYLIKVLFYCVSRRYWRYYTGQ